mgnify:FL=1
MNISIAKMDGNDYSVGLTKNKTAATAFVQEAIENNKRLQLIEKELAELQNSSGKADVVQATFTKLKKLE